MDKKLRIRTKTRRHAPIAGLDRTRRSALHRLIDKTNLTAPEIAERLRLNVKPDTLTRYASRRRRALGLQTHRGRPKSNRTRADIAAEALLIHLEMSGDADIVDQLLTKALGLRLATGGEQQ